MKKYLIFLFICLVLACGDASQSSTYKNDDENSSQLDGEPKKNGTYADGTYCSDVEYYYSETGTRSNYQLNVDVENNEVVKIHWPNSGWLDEDHFRAESLDGDGSCSFRTDKGVQFSIKITGPECSYTDNSKFRNDVEDDEKAVTCPNCGHEKDTYNDLCDDCKDKKEKTCPKCGEYDRYMYSTDDECSKCKDKEEHTCPKCGEYDSFIFSKGDLCSDCERDQKENN